MSLSPFNCQGNSRKLVLCIWGMCRKNILLGSLSLSYTKRRIGGRVPANPSFGITTTLQYNLWRLQIANVLFGFIPKEGLPGLTHQFFSSYDDKDLKNMRFFGTRLSFPLHFCLSDRPRHLLAISVIKQIHGMGASGWISVSIIQRWYEAHHEKTDLKLFAAPILLLVWHWLFRIWLCWHHRLYSRKVGVIPKLKEGWARPSFFWYDTDKDLKVCFLMAHINMGSKKLMFSPYFVFSGIWMWGFCGGFRPTRMELYSLRLRWPRKYYKRCEWKNLWR